LTPVLSAAVCLVYPIWHGGGGGGVTHDPGGGGGVVNKHLQGNPCHIYSTTNRLLEYLVSSHSNYVNAKASWHHFTKLSPFIRAYHMSSLHEFAKCQSFSEIFKVSRNISKCQVSRTSFGKCCFAKKRKAFSGYPYRSI
jgi:hypothetical protein